MKITRMWVRPCSLQHEIRILSGSLGQNACVAVGLVADGPAAGPAAGDHASGLAADETAAGPVRAAGPVVDDLAQES